MSEMKAIAETEKARQGGADHEVITRQSSTIQAITDPSSDPFRPPRRPGN